MTTGLVLDELDVNLSPLATRLVVIIIVVVGSSTHAWTFDATGVSTVAGRVVVIWRSIGIGDVSHCTV